MNLIQTLDDELKQLHLNDFEKARYIYLRCCEIFSFDARWEFTDLFNDFDLHKQIEKRKFNIEDINDYLVICHSFSKYILKPLIDKLTNLECNLISDTNHSFVTIRSNDNTCHGQTWKLDATIGDLALVKLDLPTKGFNCGISQYDIMIDDMDIDLGFCNTLYEDYERKALGYSFTECIENVGIILKNSNAKYHYSDARSLFDMLASAYSNNNRTYLDKNYNFHRLVEIFDEFSFFDLTKHNDEYKIKRINYEEYKKLTKSLYHK